MRFDVPVVGLPTVESMKLAGATALAIDANRTLLFDREKLIAWPTPLVAMQAFPFKEERAICVNGQRRRPGQFHGFDGRQTDHGYIEAHVLPGFTNLHDHQRAAVGEARGARNRLVRALHCFHGHTSTVRNHDRLPDIPRRDVPRGCQGRTHVNGFLRAGNAPRQNARFRQQWLQKHR